MRNFQVRLGKASIIVIIIGNIEIIIICLLTQTCSKYTYGSFKPLLLLHQYFPFHSKTFTGITFCLFSKKEAAISACE